MTTTEELYQFYRRHSIVCTDTRTIQQGCIFFALKGASFDGNAFAEDALNKGAAYAVIDNPSFKKNDRLILVNDVLDSLQHLANYHRRQLKCPVLAITGSNGKTTTKELISRVMSGKFRTHSTKGNLNNHIGVPLTILSAPPDTEMLIVEMGANHQKEIQLLSGIAMPDYGLINNVGKAHLEGFGGFDGVKKGKGELYEFLASHHGCVFMNGDNPHLKEMARERNVKRKVIYGTDPAFDCSGKLLESSPFLKVEWKTKTQRGVLATQLIGEYNFENILAAACTGSFFGVDAGHIKEAIESYSPDNSRSQILKRGSNTIVLDAYNANPASMEAALRNFSKMEGENKMVFIGEMAELGAESNLEHRNIVDLIGKLKFQKVILVGKNFTSHPEFLNAEYFNSSSEAATWAKSQRIADASILIKGSRSCQMELVLEGLG